jgi:hypothetical protein
MQQTIPARATPLSVAALLDEMSREESSPVFVVRRGDRLMARIKHVLYGWRFAKQVGGRVVVLWPPAGKTSHLDGKNYSPSLIFDMSRMAQDRDTRDLRFLETAELLPPKGRSLEDDEFAAMRHNRFERDLFKQSGLAFFEGSLIRYSFADEKLRRPQMNAEISRLFNLLPLHPQVASVMEKIRADLDGKKFVGLHARGGDVFEMLRDDLPGLVDNSLSDDRLKIIIHHYVVRTAPRDFYVPWIDQAIGEGMKIVFSSDTPQQIEWFKQRFGADHFIDLADYTAEFPIQKALVDFITLTRGARLLGTRSNFSSLASEIGGIENVIVAAAANNGMAESDAIQLYFDQAVARFLANVQLDPASAQRLRSEITRQYKFVNRLGSKEEILALDPRPRAKWFAAHGVSKPERKALRPATEASGGASKRPDCK